MKEKEGANVIGGGLRRETWIHPGDGRRVRRTTSAATANEARLSHTSDLEELSQLTSVEVSVPLVTCNREACILDGAPLPVDREIRSIRSFSKSYDVASMMSRAHCSQLLQRIGESQNYRIHVDVCTFLFSFLLSQAKLVNIVVIERRAITASF